MWPGPDDTIADDARELERLRAVILNRLIAVTTLLAAVPVAAGIWLALSNHLPVIAVFDAAAMLTLVAAWRGRFPDVVRALVVTGLPGLAGLVLFAYAGPLSLGAVWLGAVPALAGVLFDRRAFWLAQAGVVVSFGAMWFFVRDSAVWTVAGQPVGAAWWLTAGSSMVCVSSFVGLPAAYLVHELRVTLLELGAARRRAEAGNAAKGRFLATMSHEIRTPLNGVLGMAQLLQAHDLPEPQRREATEVILRSGQLLLALLNDVLDLTRAESGRLPITPTPTQPEEIITETCALFSASARERTHPLHHEWRGPPGAAYLLDGIRVRQMLSNLVNNAIKFSEGGEVRVVGSVEGDRLRFEVSDEGPGIAPDRLGQLFRPFSQLDSERGGSGLGLSITRTLAEEMGGEVGARNNAARGATFWFTVAAAPTAAPPTDASKEEQPPCDGRGKHVLVVEDNPVNRRLTELVLSRLNFEVTCVQNGKEAVDWLARNRVDLVLMDCQMPVMDGFEATRELRRLGASPRLPIVALTASAFPEDRAHCLEAGMDDLLLKPLDVKALKAVMERWVA
jgi:signal transduction histidine kinase/CheY-like chemotaxis protein